jgi:DNA-binding transcriptional ArsR family regulator
MSQSTRVPDSLSASTPPTSAIDADELLGLLGDEYAREVVDRLSAGARTGPALVEACDASKATVYRRLNRLEEVGLVASRTALDPDGHHHQVYRLTIAEATLSLDADGLTAAVSPADGDDVARTRTRAAAPADD